MNMTKTPAPRPHEKLIADIETFIAANDMAETYFGAKSIKNSKLLARLRAGRRIWPETEKAIRDFMASGGK